MDRIDLKQATAAQTAEFVSSLGEKQYKARQIRKWLFERGVSDFSRMTDLSKNFRALLAEKAKVTELKEDKRLESKDGTIKFLFRLADGLSVESVWIPEGKRRTLCVSTQVGCRLNCRFCLTGRDGFKRDLTAGEIIDQVVQARKRSPDKRVTNVVLMGMGEPLDNFENTLQALKVMTDSDFRLVGVRKITLSTAGVAPAIERLAKLFPKVKLAVSLNSCDDAVRNDLMPINKKYPLKYLASTLSGYPLPKGRKITIEYVLLSGVNDSDEAAGELDLFARRFPSKINLIPYNPCPGVPYESPERSTVDRFARILLDRGHSVFIRESRGRDIMAACGQLRESAPSRMV